MIKPSDQALESKPIIRIIEAVLNLPFGRSGGCFI